MALAFYDVLRTAGLSELARTGPADPRIVAVYAAGDPALNAISPSYNEALEPGSLVAFLDSWIVAESAEAAIAALESYASSSSFEAVVGEGEPIPLTFLFSGNWGEPRYDLTFFYRNALFFRAGPADRELLPPGGEPIVVRPR